MKRAYENRVRACMTIHNGHDRFQLKSQNYQASGFGPKSTNENVRMHLCLVSYKCITLKNIEFYLAFYGIR